MKVLFGSVSVEYELIVCSRYSKQFPLNSVPVQGTVVSVLGDHQGGGIAQR